MKEIEGIVDEGNKWGREAADKGREGRVNGVIYDFFYYLK